ncbi:phage tail tape measure protein [Sphingobium sp. JS3065]|uniref:phage tail tape measure protein n=1 Tax=Sphingobium sp. JS3065 TaxID=2970925 RepID=UPI0022640AD9|nr:phage tail tape measure protein [Sphingobium sp. JS3065]UZW54063.1 phage tail tape measure protein [Sphingobium sp. JS3065]
MATGGALIGALRVTLGLDSAEFEAGTKKARAAAKSQVSAIQAEFDKLRNAGAALAQIWAGSELVAAGKRALDYASSLGEVAQQLGVTTKDLQTYRYAASQAGISQDEMDRGLAKLTRTIGEAKAGSKAQATTFRELGVAVEDANGRVYTAGEVIPKLADALSQVKDPATRARIETELFGKAGQKLDTLLASGSAAVNELRDAAQQLGLVLSDEQIQKADETADKLAAIKQVLEAKMASTVAENADAILTLANALGVLAAKSLEAVTNFSNLRNLRGVNFAASPTAAKNLLSTAQGRQVLARDIQSRMDRNMAARASGEGDAGALDAEFKNLVRARNAVIRAGRAADRIAAAKAKTGTAPEGALPTVAETAKKPRKPSGPTAEETAQKHEQEMSRLRQEQLQAQLQLTNNAEDRADLQSQLLLEEYTERKAQVENDEHFTVDQKKAQVAALKALYGVSGEGDDLVVGGNRNSLSAGISREMQERLAREAFDMQSADIEIRRGDLQGQLNMARTAEERRRIELEILDLEYKLREAKLDQVINSQDSSQAEKELAQMQMDRLGQQRWIDEANISRQTMGPMATYLDSLPQTAGEVNEAFEQIAANGLANMNDQLASAAANTLKLKGLAGQLFNQLIADVIKLNIQAAMGGTGGIFGGLLKLGGSLFGGGNPLAGSLTTANSNIASLAAGVGRGSFDAYALPGLAVGGTIGGIPGVDKNILSINGIPAARVSANERITVHPNAANENGRRTQVEVIKGDLFDVIVRHEAAGVAGLMAVASGVQARKAAGSDVARVGRRRIPGRG